MDINFFQGFKTLLVKFLFSSKCWKHLPEFKEHVNDSLIIWFIFRQSCEEQGIGLDDPYRSHPTLSILCIYYYKCTLNEKLQEARVVLWGTVTTCLLYFFTFSHTSSVIPYHPIILSHHSLSSGTELGETFIWSRMDAFLFALSECTYV